MFGYIIVNRQELKLRELDVYQSWYCGLCRQLKEKYGVKGQLTLTYDMTFLILLLSGLYEAEEETAFIRVRGSSAGKACGKKQSFYRIRGGYERPSYLLPVHGRLEG